MGVTRDKWGRWERNEGRPPSQEEMLDIARSLMLSYTDRATLLMSGHFLPSEEDTAYVVERLQGFLDQWPHPAFILDYSWRFMAVNRLASEAWGIPPDVVEQLLPLHPNILDFMFDHRFQVRDRLETAGGFRELARGQLYRYRNDLRHALQAPWMSDLLGRLSHCPDFYELWQAALQDRMDTEFRTVVTVQMVHGATGQAVDYWLFWTESLVDPRFFAGLFVPKRALEMAVAPPAKFP